MRSGELLALQWEDVDLEGQGDSGPHLSVKHTLVNDRGHCSLGEPKSENGRRKIDLSPSVVSALKEHKALLFSEGLRANPYVFPNKKGGPMQRNHVLERFKAMLEHAELNPRPFHALRHTAATMMLLGGIHPKVVQEILGHYSVTLTLDTYSHAIPTIQKDAAAQMDRLFEAG